MPTPPFNTTTVLSWLSTSGSFIDTYTRNTFPNIANSVFCATSSFNSESNNNFGTAEIQTLAAYSAFKAYQATGNSAWLTRGINYTNSLITYYYPNTTPPTILNSSTLWVSKGAINASNSAILAEGTQNTSKPFNYGRFDVTINCVSGVCTIPTGGTTAGELLSRVFKVYGTNGSLLFQNVYSSLKTGTNYTIDYWVTNYRGLGTAYKLTTEGTITPTTETIGTIKLGGAYANYTGQAKVVYSTWDGTTITALGGVETYPINHAGTDYFGVKINSLYTGTSCFNLAFSYTNNISYANAYNANKQTLINASNISNPSYFYKKEPGEPFMIPGSQAVPFNRDVSGFTATRVTTSGVLQYYLRLDIDESLTSNPYFELQNYIVLTDISSTISVHVEAATSVSQILEIALNTSEEYCAYWLIAGDSAPHSININYSSFVRWGAGTIWHSLIASNPLVTYGTGTQTITQEQTTIDGRLAIAQVVTITPSAGIAGVGLTNATFTNQPPKVKLATITPMTMVVQDSDGDYWRTVIPNTNNSWVDFSPLWSAFINSGGKTTPGTGVIQSCTFETSVNGVIKLYYAGSPPITASLSSTSSKAIIRSRVASAQTIWIGNFYPVGNSNDVLKYTPGIVPSTINVVSNGSGGFISDSWGGSPYAVYQSPYHWQLWGYADRANQVLQFLNDSQIAYQKQNTTGLLAPLAPVFLWKYWKTAEFRSYGSTGDEWSFKGSDTDAASFYYCAKPMESVARYLILVPSSNIAKLILTRYLIWIQQFLVSSSGQPPTDVLPLVNPQTNYHDPASSAVIMRTALYANVAGLLPEITIDIIQRCYNYLSTQYISSGVMAGSFTAGQPTFVSSSVTYREYFALWHMETINTLAELINYKDRLNYPYQDLIAKAGVYPSLIPAFVDEIKLPPFKANRVKFDDGSTQRTLLSQSGVKTEISLKYDFLTADEAKVLIDFWRVSQGTRIPFTLPSNVLRSPTVIISGITAQGSTTYWRFAEGFDIETEFANSTRGIYGASVRIVSVVN